MSLFDLYLLTLVAALLTGFALVIVGFWIGDAVAVIRRLFKSTR